MRSKNGVNFSRLFDITYSQTYRLTYETGIIIQLVSDFERKR
jgi:hypothetical protein